MIESTRRFTIPGFHDEQATPDLGSEAIDFRAASESLSRAGLPEVGFPGAWLANVVPAGRSGMALPPSRNKAQTADRALAYTFATQEAVR